MRVPKFNRDKKYLAVIQNGGTFKNIIIQMITIFEMPHTGNA